MATWRITVSEANFQEMEKRRFTSVAFGQGRLSSLSRMRPGDRIAVYVKGTRGFGAVIKVVGRKVEEEHEPVWPDGSLLPLRINTAPIVVYGRSGFLFLSAELLDFLSFIRTKNKWGASLQGGLREIPEGDCDLIESRLRKLARHGRP